MLEIPLETPEDANLATQDRVAAFKFAHDLNEVQEAIGMAHSTADCLSRLEDDALGELPTAIGHIAATLLGIYDAMFALICTYESANDAQLSGHRDYWTHLRALEGGGNMERDDFSVELVQQLKDASPRERESIARAAQILRDGGTLPSPEEFYRLEVERATCHDRI